MAGPRSGRRRRLVVVSALALVMAAWGLFAAWSLLKAHDDIQTARSAVRAVQHSTPAEFLDGAADANLAEAEARLAEANRRLDHPAVASLRWVPWLGRQVSSVTALAEAAGEATDLATTALDRFDAAVGDGVPAGPERPAALRQVADTAAWLRDGLADLDLGPDHALLGRLSDARTEFAGDLADLDRSLDRLSTAAAGLADLLDGPHRYLVLAANNAQMQNGQGMFLDYGVLETDGGSFTLSELSSLADLAVPATPVPLDPDTSAAWPWMDPNHDWRHLGTTARFPSTAATAQRLWAATGQPPIDGVLSVDAVALRALLMLTGPVTIDGAALDADTVVPFVLHDQYSQYLATGNTDVNQAAREDRLRAVAGAALEAFDQASHLDLSALAVLADAARARHLMAWSSVPDQQAGFEAAGIDGSLPPRGVLLSVVNRGGNKLDWFLGVRADMSVETGADADHVVVTVALHNRVDPAAETRYVAGPYPSSGLVPGQYLGVVTMSLPDEAANVDVEGGNVVVAGPDGGGQLVGAEVLVDAGGNASVVFAFDLPPGTRSLPVLPSGRAEPIEWHLGDQSVLDALQPTLSWG
jgi:hypothetical protein